MTITLGAQRGTIVRLVLGQGAAQLCVGTIAELTIAVGITPLLSVILVGVRPHDP